MRLAHTALFVRDLEGAREFFLRYFACAAGPLYHNPTTGFRSYFLTFSGGGRLELMARPDVDAPPVPGCCGFDHIAVDVGSPAAVDELTARLSRDGFPVVSGPRVTGDGYYESCVLTAEGCRIEITG